MSCPLNQIYKINETLKQYPDIAKTYDELNTFALKNNFCELLDDGGYKLKGRRYDNAVLFNSVDFNEKIVCELGARDGIFSSWLTKYVDKIYTSDYFELWGKGTEYDLGSFDYWANIWKNASYDQDKLVPEIQDITNITHLDNTFDIVICTSVIEHMITQCDFTGDMVGIREIVRIVKPGGTILLSTDMTSGKSKWHSGTFYYNEIDLFDRIINPSKCKLNGNYDFNFNNETNDAITYIDGVGMCSPVVLSLIKNF